MDSFMCCMYSSTAPCLVGAREVERTSRWLMVSLCCLGVVFYCPLSGVFFVECNYLLLPLIRKNGKKWALNCRQSGWRCRSLKQLSTTPLASQEMKKFRCWYGSSAYADASRTARKVRCWRCCRHRSLGGPAELSRIIRPDCLHYLDDVDLRPCTKDVVPKQSVHQSKPRVVNDVGTGLLNKTSWPISHQYQMSVSSGAGAGAGAGASAGVLPLWRVLSAIATSIVPMGYGRAHSKQHASVPMYAVCILLLKLMYC